jgi:DNA mismatch repair protein MutS
MATPDSQLPGDKDGLTPGRRQYLQLKRRYPDTVLLFRMGDFYEAFDDDAKLISSALGIVLTARDGARGTKIPMAGVPYHALDPYLAKLVKAGHRVAVCEQLSDPRTSKGIVDRDVTRIVTPGTIVEPSMLEEKENNYLVALVAERARGGGDAPISYGLAYVDVTTGEFATTQIARDDTHTLERELERLGPAEILVSAGDDAEPVGLASVLPGVKTTPVDAWKTDLATAREALCHHFEVASLEGFGCAQLPLAIRAAGAILQYVAETRRAALTQIVELRTYQTADYMLLDVATKRNLELAERARGGSARGSVLGVIDRTKTPGGARLLRRWLSQPLLDLTGLTARLDAVEEFVRDTACRAGVREQLGRSRDLERLIVRIGQGIATPKDLIALKATLEGIPSLRAALAPPARPAVDNPRLRAIAARLDDGASIVELIGAAIVDDPPANLADSGLIREGFASDLDEVRRSTEHARRWIENLEVTERERTGIRGLKVGYNRVFGYYIEISNANREIVPETYIRKQTLVGAERYITPELKEYETIVLNARERMSELEHALFRQVCAQIASDRQRVAQTADVIANADVVAALAEVAVQNKYVRPVLDDSRSISVTGGRHPVVEEIRTDVPFTPNDVALSSDDSQIVILTGPNMAGKSTYLRQVALIVLLAQIGSFVPADTARIGLVDRIFTRVGAQDDLAAGQSTFLVEMLETANLLTQSTGRSLLILDEVGRGTSTYDGLAIAQAIVEYIHNHPRLGARTVFATHYHELTELANVLPRVRNYRMDVREEGTEVHFLHRVVPGGADRSYGIHVARLAGIPRAVTRRAEEILKELEKKSQRGGAGRVRERESSAFQLTLIGETNPAVEELRSLDVLSLTPIEAIGKLYDLQQLAGGAEVDQRDKGR